MKSIVITQDNNLYDSLARTIGKIISRSSWEIIQKNDLESITQDILNGKLNIDLLIIDASKEKLDFTENCKKIKKHMEIKESHIHILLILDRKTQIIQEEEILWVDDFLLTPFSENLIWARLSLVIKNIFNIKDKIEFSKQLLITSEINDQLIDKLFKGINQISVSLSNAVQYKDSITGNHNIRVGLLSENLARVLEMDQVLEHIRYSGFFHDIGKIGIPDHILKKPGKLTEEEFNEIKKHPIIGAQIMEPIQFFNNIVEGIKYHHERWDGKGYPEGLKERDIPIMARIISVADVFDVILSKRPYKEPATMPEAIAEIKKNAGTQFDPEVATALEHLFKEGSLERIYIEIEQYGIKQLL